MAQQKETLPVDAPNGCGVGISATGDAELHVGHYEYSLRPNPNTSNAKAKSKKRTSWRKRISSVFRKKPPSTSLSGHSTCTDTYNALTKTTTRSSSGCSSDSLDYSDDISEPVPKLLNIQTSNDVSYQYNYHKTVENDSIVMVITFILQIIFLCLRQSQFQFNEVAQKKTPKNNEDVYEPVPHVLSNDVTETSSPSRIHTNTTTSSRAMIGIPKEIAVNVQDYEEDLVTVTPPKHTATTTATSSEEVQLQCQRQTTLNALLSLRLVDASIEERHEKQLVEKYRKMLLTLEQRHREKQLSLEQHIHHLEEQIQRHNTKGRASPECIREDEKLTEDDMEELPSFQMGNDHEQASQTDILRTKPRRWMASMFYPAEVQLAADILCPIRSSSAATTSALPTGKPYSMTSSIIEENQFFPAMLAAIAKL